MATSTGRRSLAPIGLVLAVGLSGCATATPSGSGSPADSSSAASSRSVASSAVTGVPVATSVPASSPVPGSSFPVPATRASVGTQASIPEAPVSASTQEAGATTPAEPPSAAPITSDAGVVATPLTDCNPGTLKTVLPGRLTFTAGSDARGRRFIGDDPASGQGYEAALARAVASQLSYPSTTVTWAASDLGQVKAGKATGFDIALGEFRTPNGADAPVDYSTGYFSISDSVVARVGTEAAGRTKLGELKRSGWARFQDRPASDRRSRRSPPPGRLPTRRRRLRLLRSPPDPSTPWCCPPRLHWRPARPSSFSGNFRRAGSSLCSSAWCWPRIHR